MPNNTTIFKSVSNYTNLNHLYLNLHSDTLKKIPYLPNVTIYQAKGYFRLDNLYDYLLWVANNLPDLFAYFDLEKMTPNEWQAVHSNLHQINTGGFGHGESAGIQYKNLQKDKSYFLSRKCGYMGLIKLLGFLGNSQITQRRIIVDLLAGNGTFSRVFHRLFTGKCDPCIFGIDVSEVMVADAISQNLPIHRASSFGNLLANDIADAVISAYGTHHVPVSERDAFVHSGYNLLKNKGRFVIQDFLPTSNTGKWYSEIINRYREGGHQFTHFTEEVMFTLLRKYFKYVNIHYVYDPFVMYFDTSLSDIDIKKQFYIYMIRLFSLKKLLPDQKSYDCLVKISSENTYWQSIEAILKPYFTVSERFLSKALCADNAIEKINCFSILKMNEQKILVAPRIAIAGVAIK